MGRYLDVARSGLTVTDQPDEPKPTQRTATEAQRRLPDLGRILPPPSWLTPNQRRLWWERTAAYTAQGMARPAAEQEAMAELVLTGKLIDPSQFFSWPT